MKRRDTVERELAGLALAWEKWWMRLRRAMTALQKNMERQKRLRRTLEQIAAADLAERAEERNRRRIRRQAKEREREAPSEDEQPRPPM